METEKLQIKYPSGLEQAVHMTKKELEWHIRLMAALKMFAARSICWRLLERYWRDGDEGGLSVL